MRNLPAPLKNQPPKKLQTEGTVTAEYDKDPGGGLDAILAEGYAKLPKLTLTDSRKTR